MRHICFTSAHRVSTPRHSSLGIRTETAATELDEACRMSLHNQLQTHGPNDSLPSADFLLSPGTPKFQLAADLSENLRVRAYRTNFQPIFPLLHIKTLSPSLESSLLLLGICSVRGLFEGGADAATKFG